MAQPTNQGTESRGSQNSASRRPIRWWPVPVILLAAAGGIIWVSQFYGKQRQDRNLASAGIALITLLLLLLWCICFSRMRRKLRVTVLGSVVGLMLLTKALFRIHGVTGDLVPILQWRWSRTAWVSPDAQAKPGVLPGRSDEFTNDYPQFLGPNRNGMVAQPRLARDWGTQPPQRLWLQPVGPGWSGFAVVGNRAVTQEQRGENETVNCYDLLSGVPLWSYAYPAHFQSDLAGEGPRATPTISGNRVYALGSSGILNMPGLGNWKTGSGRTTIEKDNGGTGEQLGCQLLAIVGGWPGGGGRGWEQQPVAGGVPGRQRRICVGRRHGWRGL